MKLLILLVLVLALGSRLIPTVSWALAFFSLLLLADLVRAGFQQLVARGRAD